MSMNEPGIVSDTEFLFVDLCPTKKRLEMTYEERGRKNHEISTLDTVVKSLVSSSKFVPYRDAIITRLLQVCSDDNIVHMCE